jgi:hypothetical protein
MDPIEKQKRSIELLRSLGASLKFMVPPVKTSQDAGYSFLITVPEGSLLTEEQMIGGQYRHEFAFDDGTWSVINLRIKPGKVFAIIPVEKFLQNDEAIDVAFIDDANGKEKDDPFVTIIRFEKPINLNELREMESAQPDVASQGGDIKALCKAVFDKHGIDNDIFSFSRLSGYRDNLIRDLNYMNDMLNRKEYRLMSGKS